MVQLTKRMLEAYTTLQSVYGEGSFSSLLERLILERTRESAAEYLRTTETVIYYWRIKLRNTYEDRKL